MKPVILFRKTYRENDEFEIAKKHFDVVNSRTLCHDALIICRYSCLPFYRELEIDLQHNKCQIINSYNQHCWIADFGYYYELMDYTPKSYTQDNFYAAPEGQYVVKGATNSRKIQWKTHMFAENKQSAIKIASELRQDGLLCDQEIIFRKFEHLKVLEIDEINGIPYSNEWRFFYYKNTRLSYGFYWSSGKDETIKEAKMDEEGLKFADKVAQITSENVDFFVLDIAEKKDGGWILIEINDAQQSGLSENDPNVLYENLAKALKNEHP